MKKIGSMLAAALLAASMSASADEETQNNTVFTATEGSPYAELCLAALESREALARKAQELNIKRRALDQVACNDMNLIEFARAYQEEPRERAIATVQ